MTADGWRIRNFVPQTNFRFTNAPHCETSQKAFSNAVKIKACKAKFQFITGPSKLYDSGSCGGAFDSSNWNCFVPPTDGDPSAICHLPFAMCHSVGHIPLSTRQHISTCCASVPALLFPPSEPHSCNAIRFWGQL